MESIFDEHSYRKLLSRVESLHEKSPRQWGKMSVGQMAWHCQIPLRVAVENRAGKVKGNPLIRWFFKRSLYNDTPWRKNLPTLPMAKTEDPKDLQQERLRLLQLMEELHRLKDREHWNPHPLFGKLSREQWGMMNYKHLDHHLRQFGA